MIIVATEGETLIEQGIEQVDTAVLTSGSSTRLLAALKRVLEGS